MFFFSTKQKHILRAIRGFTMKKIVVSICMSIALLFGSILLAFAEEYDIEEDTAAAALVEETADEETAAAAEQGDNDKDVSQADNSGQTLAEYTGQLYHIDIRVVGAFTYETSYDAANTILDIEKIWEDDEEHDDIIVYLLGEDGEVLTDDDGNERYVTLSNANDWSTELEEDDVYAVEEEDIDGYTASYEYDIPTTDEDVEEYSTTGTITVESINWVTYTDSSENTVTITGTYTEATSESGAEYAYEFFCSDRTLEDFYDTSTININLTFTYSYIDENGEEQSDEITKTFTFTADTESNTCANLTANSDDDDSNDIYDETMYGYDAVITFEMDDIVTTKQTVSAVITNTPEEEEVEVFDLVLSKSVSGTDTDDIFSFDIYIDGAEGTSYSGLYVSEDGEEDVTIVFDEDGYYTAQLGSGESLYIYGFPAGTTYTVTEEEYEYYTPYVDSVQTDTVSGTIDGDASVEFVNEYEFLELDYDADIDITKIFTGDADASASFYFTIEPLSDEAAEKFETAAAATQELSLTAEDAYSSSETLSGIFGTLHFTQDDVGQTFTYTISEIIPDDAEDGYVYDDSVYTVSFTISSDGSSLYVDTLIADADGNEVDEIAFYNTYEMPTGSLLISKEVTGDAPEDTFAFTIEAYLVDGSPLDGTYNGYTFTDGLLTIYLEGGEEALIEGIPEGVIYTVTEEEYDDYDTTVNGESGRTISGTITAGTIDTAAFVNEYASDEPVVSTMPKTGDDSLAMFFVSLIAGIWLLLHAIFHMRRSSRAVCDAEETIDVTDESIRATVQTGTPYKAGNASSDQIRRPDDSDSCHKKKE